MFDLTSPGEDTTPRKLIRRKLYQTGKTIYYLSFRALLYARCAFRSAFEEVFRAPHIDVPPPLLRYKVSESFNISLFVNVGQQIAAAIEQALNEVGSSFNHMSTVLDFGCGCGRVVKWLMARFPHARFFGTDIDAPSIRWCQEHLCGSFYVNGDSPPLTFADCELDCVYAISVFTHLDEEYQLKWLAELRRIWRPGGLLLVSVHGIGTMKELGMQDAATLQAHGILFKRSSKLRGIHPEFYQTAFQTKEYVMRRWSAFFEIVAYRELGLGYQDLVVLRRE